MRAATAAEDQKRRRALDRHAADQGETRWRLSVREESREEEGLEVRAVSFAELDAPGSSSDDEEEEGEERRPRKSLRVAYGRPRERVGNKERGGEEEEEEEEEEEDGSEGESEGEYDPLGVGDLIEKGRAAAGGRRSPDHIGFRSISSANPGAMKCFRCGGPHRKAECPRG
jgi:hypothetical protein